MSCFAALERFCRCFVICLVWFLGFCCRLICIILIASSASHISVCAFSLSCDMSICLFCMCLCYLVFAFL